MRVDKVLNNNVITTIDAHGNERVVMGKGLGFQMKTGMPIDDKKIEKIFDLASTQDGGLDSRYRELLEAIPLELLMATEEIIETAAHALPGELHPSIRISLADHLFFALERCIQGKQIKNAMLWEIRQLYPKEFAVGMQALAIIQQASRVQFPDDEAGFIAMHLVNAQLKEDMHNTMEITTLIRDIIQLIKFQLRIDMDEESLSFQRLVTHLKFFAHRLLKKNTVVSDDDSLFQSVKVQYPKAFACTEKIRAFVEQRYTHLMTNEEMMFLTIHVERVRRADDDSE